MLLGMFVFTASPALAIANPDTISINAVYAYRHCIETDDQLYLIDYSIEYGANPDENITEAYLCRLMEGVVEWGAVAPYAYYDDGYDRGLIAIYFPVADAPGWAGAGLSMELVGNPTLGWAGATPESSVGAFDLWSTSTGVTETQAEVAARVLYIADILEQDWGVDLIDTAGGINYLTAYGENYFSNVIPYLNLIAPAAFSGSMVAAEFEERTYTQTYSTTLRTAIIGTPLDFTTLAASWGVPIMFVSSILYLMIMALVLYFTTVKVKSYKPALLLSIPMMIAGVLLGMLPLLLLIMFGFFAILGIGYAFFYQKGYG